MKLLTKLSTIAVVLTALIITHSQAAGPVQLKSQFNADEIKWIKTNGNSSISGTAFLQLNEKEQKGCAGFGVELLPVASYSKCYMFELAHSSFYVLERRAFASLMR